MAPEGISSSKMLKLKRVHFKISIENYQDWRDKSENSFLQIRHMEKVWVDVWLVSSVQHYLWRLKTASIRISLRTYMSLDIWSRGFLFILQSGRYSGEISEQISSRTDVSRNEVLLHRRKYIDINTELILHFRLP